MQQWTISWSDCDVLWKVDFIQQPSQWSYREEAPKNFPKPNLHQKKGHGHCLVICYLSDPLQLSEFWWNHYIWEVYSADWWDASKTMTPAAGSSQHNGPRSSPWQYPTTCHTINNFWLYTHSFKSWMNWATKFCLIHHIHLTSHQLTTTSSSILTTFCRENTSTTSRRQKTLSKSLLNPEAWIFTLQE